jgi:hypothetical protein
MHQQSERHPEVSGGAVTNENRATERFATVRDASCSLVTQRQKGFTLRIHNISASGIGLLSGHRFEPGSILLVQVREENPSRSPLLVAKVVHATSQPTGDWLIGCILTRGLSEAEVRALVDNEAKERRKAPRFASVRDASCSPLLDRRLTVTVRLHDVSTSGIGFVSQRRFERGSTLLLQILGESPELPQLLVGKVVHVTAQATGEWLIGCALARGLSESDVQALAESAASAEQPGPSANRSGDE